MKITKTTEYTVLIAKRGVDACVGSYSSLDAVLIALENFVSRQKLSFPNRKKITYSIIMKVTTTIYTDDGLFDSRVRKEYTIDTVTK